MGALRSAAVLTTVGSEITQRAPDASLQRDRSRRESALGDVLASLWGPGWFTCVDAWGSSPTQPALPDGPSQEAGPPLCICCFPSLGSLCLPASPSFPLGLVSLACVPFEHFGSVWSCSLCRHF